MKTINKNYAIAPLKDQSNRVLTYGVLPLNEKAGLKEFNTLKEARAYVRGRK